jgi:hypothetical protein
MASNGSAFVVDTPAPEQLACIIDARLALSRGGLLAVASLASMASLDVWLPRELRELIRQPLAFLNAPGLLRPLLDAQPGEDLEILRRELSGWERFMANSGLARLRLFFLGDRSDESAIPLGTDDRLSCRCELLQRSLDALPCRATSDPQSALVADCSRDALSLSAALLPRRAFVLTRVGSGRDESPAICEYLRARGIRVPQLPHEGGSSSRSLRAALAHGGLGTLAWAGVRIAVLQVVMPGFPAVLGSSERDPAELSRVWLDTDVFWHEVTP